MTTKNLFGGLLKITGKQWEAYNAAKVDGIGKIIFANIIGESDDEHNGKYIWANGVEYKIADDSAFKQLVERVEALEAWKPDVDASIDRLDSSVSTLEALLADYSEWKASVDSSIDELQAKDIEIDASIDDISTRLSNALVDASISAAVADNSTLITLKTINDAAAVSTTSVKVSGSNYVNVDGTENNITLSVTTASVADATVSGEGLADAKDVQDYVSNVLKDLQALKFISDIKEDTANELLTTNAREAGDAFVATGNTFDYNGEHIEAGDLVIVKLDSAAGVQSSIMVVERNLDGAVTASAALDSSKLVVGDDGKQGVKTIDITVDDLSTAIANANSAVQGVEAATTQNAYVTISVDTSAQNASVKDVSAVLTVVDTSAALSTVTATGSLVDAVAVKEFVEGKIEEIPEVEMTLDSSTPAYVTTSATVSDGAINASVGVITATLADASNGSIGLAMAKDVYDELSKVEEVMATSVTKMQETLGMDASLSVDWDPNSGIAADSTYKAAIEGAYKAAHEAVVTSFAGKTGDISLAPASQTAGDINLTISANGSVLSAAIVDLSTYVATAIDSSIKLLDVDSTEVANKVLVGVSETDGKVDSSAVALVINGQAFTHAVGDPSMTATISGLDISVSDIDTSTIAERIEAINVSVNALEGATYVRSVTGESDVLTNANDAYVNVSASTNTETGAVTLDSSVQLATAVTLSEGLEHEEATGLVTDGWVKDFMSWEVIGDDVEP